MSERDQLEVDALVTDRYLESLLATRDRRTSAETTAAAHDVDPGVGSTARALESGLVRVHPSFRFEDRLATDLQVAAARQHRIGRPQRPAAIRRLEPHGGGTWAPANPAIGSSAPNVARPLLIGGALTSAAISIAGAYVAWRRGRPPLDPMVRAVRAAHRGGFARRLPARGPRPALPGTRDR